MPDAATAENLKVQELRALSLWSEGQVWCSPECHGATTGIMKSQIDWIPLEVWGDASHSGSDVGGYAGEWRVAVFQRGQ